MSSTPTTTKSRNWWSKKEDEILQRETSIQLDRGALKDWNLIAASLPGRSNKDCRKRWTKLAKQINKGAWDAEEDDTLRNAIEQHGPRWTVVSEIVGTRSADQCAKRWQHYLDPNIDHSCWKIEDDERLLQAVRMHGRNWKIISAKEFPRRSTTDLKNRYVAAERRRKQSIASISSRASSTSFILTPSIEQDDPMRDTKMSSALDDFYVDEMDIPSLASTTHSTPPSRDGKELLLNAPRYPWGDCPDPLTELAQSPEGISDNQSQSEMAFTLDSGIGSEWGDSLGCGPDLTMPTPFVMTAEGVDSSSGDPQKARNTLILEDLDPSMVSEIMQLMFQKNIRMKMRLESQGD